MYVDFLCEQPLVLIIKVTNLRGSCLTFIDLLDPFELAAAAELMGNVSVSDSLRFLCPAAVAEADAALAAGPAPPAKVMSGVPPP